jgi:hypothetical protein
MTLWYMDIVKNGFNAVKTLTFTEFLNVNALNVNDLHRPTIRCPLNANGLLH